VRSLPASRRHPHFSAAPLAAALAARGIAYTHLPALGGLRRARPDSANTALGDGALRGYADHMQTPAFEDGLKALLDLAARGRVACLCAEADPSRCHRALLADALVARGVEVLHLLSEASATPHRLHPRARVHEGRVSYPGTRPGTLDL